jgi:pimeloyl-ACP methyl ester carboxylesterase
VEFSLHRLRHGKVELALHRLREGAGRTLLLLHGLGERSPSELPAELAGWPGPVSALDFTGHGDSTRPLGGGYFDELLLADADAALAKLSQATLLGRGLGAWVALLLAGSRPQAVRGALLCDGAGIAGGGPAPRDPTLVIPAGPARAQDPDPLALLELARQVRPPDYAARFVALAAARSGLAQPVWICASERPPWLAGIAGAPGVNVASVASALAACAAFD